MTICFACLGNFLSPFCCFSCSVLLPFCCSPDLATGAKTAEPDIQQAYLTALQGALLSSGDRLAPDTVAKVCAPGGGGAGCRQRADCVK